MKPEAQRIAIAEACGWKSALNLGWAGGYFATNKATGDSYFLSLSATHEGAIAKVCPDYLTDLNAMHGAEKTLYADPEKSNRYAEFILDVLEVPAPFIGTARCAFLTNHATAAQRGEAFLRTLNLWKDAP